MKPLTLFVFLIFVSVASYSQKNDSLSIFFWNVENQFHPGNDSLTLDDEFTPAGDRYWSYWRYNSKNTRIWKTIISSGSGKPPGIIALAEIENEKVLQDLFIYSPMNNFNYSYVHQDSEDRRGIDVALVYDSGRVKLLDKKFIKVNLEPVGGGPTRDILLVKLNIQSDTLCIFVNHWPSKYGGAGVTDGFRMKAAQTLVSEIDKLRKKNPEIKIILIGDFNDTPESRSMKALLSYPGITRIKLTDPVVQGTIKYQGRWEMIDHIIVSANLLSRVKGLSFNSAGIFHPEFLLVQDEKYGGIMPFRTWIGFRYQEGFSDHLPVIVKLKVVD